MKLAKACQVDAEMLSGTNQTQELAMSCTRLAEVSSQSEYDETSEQSFEQFRVCTVSSSNVDDCSNELIQWRQQQLRKIFIPARYTNSEF